MSPRRSTRRGKGSLLGRGGAKESNKWDDAHESRTGRKMTRSEISEKESLFALCILFEKSVKLVLRGCQQRFCAQKMNVYGCGL